MMMQLLTARLLGQSFGLPGHFELLTILVLLAVIVVPFWRIFAKAGFSGALALLMLIPLVNLVMIFFLAFAEWPALSSKSSER